MWHRPQSLNTLADLLFAAGAAMLLAALTIWVLRMPFLPIRTVVLETPLQQVSPLEFEEALQGKVRGNFLSLSLENARESLEALPWVRKAMVRRVWPGRLIVTLEEHRPMALWEGAGSNGETEWVNSYGEVFVAGLPEERRPQLPRFKGPASAAPLLLQRYGEFLELLQPMGAKPVSMSLSSRLALEMELDNDLVLKLGREQKFSPIRDRLQRFIQIYPVAVAGRQPQPAIVDLRYSNGFALYPAGNSSVEK
jgi:cell division protein FtsQ